MAAVAEDKDAMATSTLTAVSVSHDLSPECDRATARRRLVTRSARWHVARNSAFPVCSTNPGYSDRSELSTEALQSSSSTDSVRH